MIYAVTLTASPHKDKFKKLSWRQQEAKYINFLESLRELFSDLQYVFETCETSKVRHVHLIIQPKYEHPDYNWMDIMYTIFRDSFIAQFGYLDNPIEYHFLAKPIPSLSDYYRWQDYMYKTLTPIKIVLG